MPKTYLNFKIVIENLVGGHLAWAIAHSASKERRLLAREEIVFVMVFSSPATPFDESIAIDCNQQ